MAGRRIPRQRRQNLNELKAPRKNSHSPLRMGQTPVLTRREGLPRIEYVFDIGSDSGRSPSGTHWHTPTSWEPNSRGVTLSLLSSIFPEQAAGTAVPAAALVW